MASDDYCFLKRVAVVDTCNVIFQCAGMALDCPAKDLKKPDAVGALLVVKQLLSEAFDVRLVVPGDYLVRSDWARHGFILEVLNELGLLIAIDEGSHDDLVVLEMAKSMGGFVVSEDRYRDHHEQQADLHSTIERRCGVNFRPFKMQTDAQITEFISNRERRFMPGMELALRPSSFATMFASPEDPSYDVVLHMRMMRCQKLAQQALDAMDVCADYIQKLCCVHLGIPPPVLEYCDEGVLLFPEFRARHTGWKVKMAQRKRERGRSRSKGE